MDALFDAIDVDGSGGIEFDELSGLLSGSGGSPNASPDGRAGAKGRAGRASRSPRRARAGVKSRTGVAGSPSPPGGSRALQRGNSVLHTSAYAGSARATAASSMKRGASVDELRGLLYKNASRVVDLFRGMDRNADGKVGRRVDCARARAVSLLRAEICTRRRARLSPLCLSASLTCPPSFFWQVTRAEFRDALPRLGIEQSRKQSHRSQCIQSIQCTTEIVAPCVLQASGRSARAAPR